MATFQERLKSIGFTTYEEYLNSEMWANFKVRYRASGRQITCAVCGSYVIQLHHRTYVRLGSEEFDDVVPLCREHHDAVHEWLKTSGRIFVERTHEAIQYLRSRMSSPGVSVVGASLRPKKVRPVRPCAICKGPTQRGRGFCNSCHRKNRPSGTTQPLPFDTLKRCKCGGQPKKGTMQCRPCSRLFPRRAK